MDWLNSLGLDSLMESSSRSLNMDRLNISLENSLMKSGPSTNPYLEVATKSALFTIQTICHVHA
jgi:hypothetical protein